MIEKLFKVNERLSTESLEYTTLTETRTYEQACNFVDALEPKSRILLCFVEVKVPAVKPKPMYDFESKER